MAKAIPVSLELIALVEQSLSELHRQQCEKAACIAREKLPGVTSEDLLNPDNFPQIMKDPRFLYEDGQAAGVLSAKIAVCALLRELLDKG